MDINALIQRELNKREQTNMFLKGMNTDVSDALLDNQQYRYAENIRIITNKDSNSGEVRLIEGTTSQQLKDKDGKKLTLNLDILATNSIRNIGIVVAASRLERLWYVYKIDFNTNITTLIFGGCSEQIWPDGWDGKGKVLSTIMRYESDNNIKLYMADQTGKHSIMMLNVGDKFIGSDFESVFSYQNIPLPTPKVSVSSASGSIPSGIVQYTYRLYQKYGAATAISPLSKPISLYKTLSSGYATDKRSGRAVDIVHPTISNTLLDRIQIYRIQFGQSGQEPNIVLIKDEPLNSGFVTVDNGSSDINEIAVSEFLAMMDSQIIPKQIESKGDYLFASNLKYAQDNSDVDFANFDARSYSKGNKYNGSSVLDLSTSEWDTIDPEYLVHDAFRDESYAEFSLADWSPLSDIESGNKYIANAPSGYNGYGKCFCWKYVYDDIQTPTADKQSSTLKYTNKSFRSEEVYRFGVRLFNKRGVASSVKWIADIMMPPRTYIDASKTQVSFKNTGIEFYVNKSYEGWQNNWKDISGFEIVRCPRTVSDRCTISQGIFGKTCKYKNYLCTPGFITETDFQLQKDDFEQYEFQFGELPAATTEDSDIYMFASPEYSYQSDDVKDLLSGYEGQLKIQRVGQYYTNSESISTERNDFSGNITFIRSKQTKNEDFGYFLRSVSDNNGYLFRYDKYCVEYNSPFNKFNPAEEYINYKKTGINTIDSAKATTYWFLNYITPDYTTFKPAANEDVIDTVSFSKAPEYSDFATDNNITFKNSVVTANNYQFINWSAPYMMSLTGDQLRRIGEHTDNIDNADTSMDWPAYDYMTIGLYPLGAGGSVVLFKPKEGSKFSRGYTRTSEMTMPPISIANIRKPAVPYGGYNKTQIENSKYISFGDSYQWNDRDNVSSNESKIQVFSGDTVIRAFTYNACKSWYDSTFKQWAKNATIYCVPLECDIDIQAQYGNLYGVDDYSDYRAQDYACGFEGFVQEKDAYMYNTVYNATPDVITYYTDANNTAQFNTYDTRIHYSEPKTNNELIDSWLQYKAANFIDVDSRHGQITGMKLFKDKLIFWQEHATGLAAVNERIVLKDSSDNQVTLGVGGVLERTDYITTEYGLKNKQLAYDTSDTGLYWWDSYKNEIVLYNDGYKVSPLSTTKQVQNYINTGQESDYPTIIYDPKYKEVICNVVDDRALVYSEQIQQFTSQYTFNPVFVWNVYDNLYIIDNYIVDRIYRYNTANDGATLFGFSIYPLIKYIVNAQSQYPKVFDNQSFGGRFYNGDTSLITVSYDTPLGQHSEMKCSNNNITNYEYDYRLAIPRNDNSEYGDRMRGKTMQCEFKSGTNSLDFSLQYITTKFRVSWT